MDKRVLQCKTPEECMQLAKNVRERYPDLARDELKAIARGCKSDLEIELVKAVYAYEDAVSTIKKRRTTASRTWQMIRRHGIIEAAERAVNRPIETVGFYI